MESSNKITSRQWLIIFVAGLAGQLCWNIENQWYTTFVYEKIAPDPNIISWMVAASAVTSAVATVFFGTIGDRLGKRKPLMVGGYIIWGITVILFGLTEYVSHSKLALAAVLVVCADCLMTFFGAMAHDAGYNPWTTDITNEHNRGKLGAVIAVLPVAATIIGSLVFGNVIDAVDYMNFFIGIGVIMIFLGLFCLVAVKDAPNVKAFRDENGFWHQVFSFFKFRVLGKNRRLTWVLAIFSIYFIGFNMYFSHLTNYLIYTQGNKAGMAGIIIGVGLLVAAPFTLIAGKHIDKGNGPEIMYAAVASTIIGLVLVSLKGMIINIVGMVFVGIGYMCIFQTLMVMLKNLFPEHLRGQCEGLRSIFYILIPMCVGTPIGSAIIKARGMEVFNEYGIKGYSAGPNLFIIAAVWTLLTLIPVTGFKKALKENK